MIIDRPRNALWLSLGPVQGTHGTKAPLFRPRAWRDCHQAGQSHCSQASTVLFRLRVRVDSRLHFHTGESSPLLCFVNHLVHYMRCREPRRTVALAADQLPLAGIILDIFKFCWDLPKQLDAGCPCTLAHFSSSTSTPI